MSYLILFFALGVSAGGAILNLFHDISYVLSFFASTVLMATLLRISPRYEKTRISLLILVAASVGAEFGLFYHMFISDLSTKITYIPDHDTVVAVVYACVSISIVCLGAYRTVVKRREDLGYALAQFFLCFLRQVLIGDLIAGCLILEASYRTLDMDIAAIAVTHLLKRYVDAMVKETSSSTDEEVTTSTTSADQQELASII